MVVHTVVESLQALADFAVEDARDVNACIRGTPSARNPVRQINAGRKCGDDPPQPTVAYEERSQLRGNEECENADCRKEAEFQYCEE